MEFIYDIELFSKLEPVKRAQVDLTCQLWTRVHEIHVLTEKIDARGRSFDCFSTNGIIDGDNRVKRLCGTYAEWFMILFKELRGLMASQVYGDSVDDWKRISEEKAVERFGAIIGWLVENKAMVALPTPCDKIFAVMKLLYQNELDFRRDCKNKRN